MLNFKNIKFAFLILGILSTINIIWVETDVFDKSFRLLSFGGERNLYFNIHENLQIIIMSFMPYIFLRIWEAYYRK